MAHNHERSLASLGIREMKSKLEALVVYEGSKWRKRQVLVRMWGS